MSLASDASSRPRMSTVTFTLIALGVALGTACVVSLAASGSPDGLEYVAGVTGFAGSAQDHALATSPLADYAAQGVDVPVWSNVIVGVVGCGVTFAVAWSISALVRVRRARR